MSVECSVARIEARQPSEAVDVAVRTAAAYMGLDEPVAAVLGRCAAALAGDGNIPIPEVAALYGRTIRWVWMMVDRFNLRTTSRGGNIGSTVDFEAFVERVGLPGALHIRRGRPPRSGVAAGLVPRPPIDEIVSAASSTDQPQPGPAEGGAPIGTTPTPPTAGADGSIAQSARSIN